MSALYGRRDLGKVKEALRGLAELEKRRAEIESGLSPQERDVLSRLVPWDSEADIARIAKGEGFHE